MTIPRQLSGSCNPVMGSYANGDPTGGEASTSKVPTRTASTGSAETIRLQKSEQHKTDITMRISLCMAFDSGLNGV